ncbi:MAG: hypothetical protein ACI867_002557 [Glaciecola sp.]|jgi:uncharacterized protein (DUF58 family)
MADKKARNPRVAQSLAAGSGLIGWIERHVGITSSGLSLLGFTAMAFLIGNLVGSVALYMLGYGVLLIMGVSWLMGRRKLAVTAGRTDLPRRVREGQRVAVELSLQAQRRISTIVLEEELRDPLGIPVRVPVPILPAGEDVRHPYTFTPKRRGVYLVGPLVAEWSDPFGLTKRREVLAEAQEIMVHPSTEPVTDMVTQREWEDPPIRPPLSKPWPTGFEFYGMRDYVPGDDPRRIVWRKTAQMLDENGQGRYLVKESEQGITDRVNILLDTDKTVHTPGVPSSTFELAIRTAASLGASHLHDGFSVTIDVNESRLIARLRGRGNRITMLDALARLELETESFSKAIERLLIDPGRQAHNIVITPHLDQATAARLGLLVDRGVSMLLVHIMHDDTDPISLHRAGGIGAKVVEVTAGQPLQRVFRKVTGAFRS